MPVKAVAVAALLLVALVGCTADTSPEPSPSAESVLNPALQPVAPDIVTEQTAAAESVRLADAMLASVGTTSIVDIQDEAGLIPADDDISAYYAFQRTITLTPEMDPLTIAELLVAVLNQSGWDIFEATNEGGVYVAALAGGPEEAAWFALVGGDATVQGQSTVSIQLASPDIG